MVVINAEKTHSFKTHSFNQAHELAGIEILRLLCALTVMIWHYQQYFFADDPDTAQMARSAQPFYGPLQYAYEGGYWAVHVFWGISGFIFYWTYAQSVSERSIGLFEFATRRFSRLYPLHIVSLVIVALLQYVYFRSHGRDFIYGNNSVHAFIAQIFFASNWFKAQGYTFNGPIWSISVEIIVYFAFFAVVKKAGPAPAVAAAACGVAWVLGRINSAHISPISGTVFGCAMFFFAGGFTLWLSRQRFGILFSLCGGALTCALLASGLVRAGSGIILILTICSVAILARLGEFKYGSFLNRLAFLGNATYSSYLVHFPTSLGMVIAVDAMGYSRDIFLTEIMFVAYIILVLGISLAVYRLFERPVQKWIRDFAGQLRRSRGAFAK